MSTIGKTALASASAAALCASAFAIPTIASQQAAEAYADTTTEIVYTGAVGAGTIVFGDSGIEATGIDGVEVDGTDLKITASGTYKLTGACREGSVTVKNGITGVTLVFEGLDLSCSTGAPISINKGAEATIEVADDSKLSDKEDPADEDSADEAVADAFDGAAIKVKSGASLTVTGTAKLEIDSSSCKNGIKGASTASIVLGKSTSDSYTLSVDAANNGIASDGSITANGGNVYVVSGNDAIKSEPDDDDAESAGTVTVHDSYFNLSSQGDGIQATGEIVIDGGVFDITSFDGSANAKALGDDSAKGIKSDSGVTVNGGTFRMDTADDAIHSNGNVSINAGDYDITSGDDGIHSDLTLAIAGGDIDVTKSYEGLEGASVLVSGGDISVVASDDGINAANGDLRNWNYELAVSGGNVYVDAGSDGFDSNGDATFTSGTTYVYGGSAGDADAIDADGTWSMTEDALVVSVGGQGMEGMPGSGTYVAFGSTGSFGGLGQNAGFGMGGNARQMSQGAGMALLAAGSSYTITDESGQVVASGTAPRNATKVVAHIPSMESGKTYSLNVNGSTVATATAATGSGQSGFGPGGGNQGQEGFMLGNRTDRSNGSQGGFTPDDGGDRTNDSQGDFNPDNGNADNTRPEDGDGSWGNFQPDNNRWPGALPDARNRQQGQPTPPDWNDEGTRDGQDFDDGNNMPGQQGQKPGEFQMNSRQRPDGNAPADDGQRPNMSGQNGQSRDGFQQPEDWKHNSEEATDGDGTVPEPSSPDAGENGQQQPGQPSEQEPGNEPANPENQATAGNGEQVPQAPENTNNEDGDVPADAPSDNDRENVPQVPGGQQTLDDRQSFGSPSPEQQPTMDDGKPYDDNHPMGRIGNFFEDVPRQNSWMPDWMGQFFQMLGQFFGGFSF